MSNRPSSRVETVVLEGTHVRMEPLGFQHVPDLMNAIGQDRSTYGLTWVPEPTEESVAAYVQSALDMQAAGTALPFATVRRSDGRVCGSTRLGNIEFYAHPAGVSQPPEVQNRSTPEAAEIGWTWLGAQYQRSALNTEAKLLMLTHAFETWEVLRLTLKTDSRNTRSRNNIERIGATFEGVLRNHQYAFGGGIRHSAFYSIVLEEWPLVKANLLAKIASYDSA